MLINRSRLKFNITKSNFLSHTSIALIYNTTLRWLPTFLLPLFITPPFGLPYPRLLFHYFCSLHYAISFILLLPSNIPK